MCWWRCGGCCFPVAEKENARLLAGYQLAGEILNTSQFRRLTVVWFAGSLLKETGMVNPLCGGAISE
ncbi:hypothetical protein PCS93_13695 [Escherichia coli]|nr:hypothetical protein PCS93_13695 [Escherichia coli]